MSLGTGQTEQAAAQAQAFIIAENHQLFLLSGNTEIISAGAGTVVGNIGHVPFKKWRVIGCGFTCTGAGIANKTEHVEFGYLAGDIGVAAQGAFMRIEMDAADADEWTAGDIVFHVYKEAMGMKTGRDKEADYECADMLAEDQGGVPLVYIGAELGQWQTKQAYITAAMTGMLASAAQIVPFVLLEVEGLVTGRSD